MAKTKRTAIILITILFLLTTVMAITGCKDKISYLDITVISDKPYPNAVFKIVFQGKDMDPVEFQPAHDGNTAITSMPTGDYDVTVTYYGATVTMHRTITKNDTAVDIRLFKSLEGTQQTGRYYLIENKEQFLNIAYFSGVKTVVRYRLSTNIDFEGSAVNLGTFTGVLDGANYSLNRVKIESAGDDIGMIPVNNGTVQNLTMKNAVVSGHDRVGALCGTNNGTIESCNTDGGTVTGNEFVGGVCGLDYGSVAASSNASIVCTGAKGYYGQIAGFSYTNINLGSFGMRPSIPGATPITAEMSGKDKLQTALKNWETLENRTKLAKGAMKVDFTEIVNSVATALRGKTGDTMMETLLSIASNLPVNMTVNAEGKLIYNDAKNGTLGEVFAQGSGFISEFSLLSSQMMIQLMEILGFKIINRPVSGVMYYNADDNEYLQGSVTADGKVNASKQVITEFTDEIYWLYLMKDIEEMTTEIGLPVDYINLLMEYIGYAKDYVFYGDIMDWQNDGVYIGDAYDTSYANGIYSMKFKIDGKKLFQKLETLINDGIGRLEEIVNRLNPGLGAGSGTKISLNFKKTNLVLEAQIFDNGQIRYTALSDYDFDFVLDLSEDLTKTVGSMIAREFNNAQVTINEFKIGISAVNPIIQLYSYSASDYNIDLYKQIFKGEKAYILDMFYERDEA